MKKHEAIEALYGMIELCHEIGAVPILITTPLLNEYNDIIKQRDAKFYDDFYSLVHEVSDKTGTRYYDYSHDERYVDNHELFIDSDHMNLRGSRIFTDNLLREVLGINVTAP